MNVKRNIGAYLYCLAFIAIASLRAWQSESETGQILWKVNVGIGLFSLSSIIARQIYIELDNKGRLKINRASFVTLYVDIHKIEKVKIGTGVFDSTALILKGNKRVRLFAPDQTQLAELSGHLNIPIEYT